MTAPNHKNERRFFTSNNIRGFILNVSHSFKIDKESKIVLLTYVAKLHTRNPRGSYSRTCVCLVDVENCLQGGTPFFTNNAQRASIASRIVPTVDALSACNFSVVHTYVPQRSKLSQIACDPSLCAFPR